MGLKILGKAAKEKQIVSPSLTIDLSKQLGPGAVVKFRAPEVPDFFPPDQAKLRLAVNHPNLQDQADQILIMASCYIPDEDEDGISPVDELARLANEARDAFLHILYTFNGAFPVRSFETLVEETKNA